MSDIEPYVGMPVQWVGRDDQGKPVDLAAILLGFADGQDALGTPVEVARVRVFHPNGSESITQGIQHELSQQPGTWHLPRPRGRVVQARRDAAGKILAAS